MGAATVIQLAREIQAHVALARARHEVRQFEHPVTARELAGQAIARRVGKVDSHQEIQVLEIRAGRLELTVQSSQVERLRNESFAGEMRPRSSARPG